MVKKIKSFASNKQFNVNSKYGIKPPTTDCPPIHVLPTSLESVSYYDIFNDGKEEKISTEYIKSSFDVNLYQDKLVKKLNNTSGTRNKVVVAAKFLATEFPKIPYFWGGGHNYSKEQMIGINPNWGSLEEIVYGGDNYHVVGESFPSSLDCSGFVSWCLANAGIDLDNYSTNGEYCLNTTDLHTLGESIPISGVDTLNKVKVGDLAMKEGHVGIVVDVDTKNKEIEVAHVSGDGWGMNLTTISTETGLVVKDDLGTVPSTDKNGEEVEVADRVGKRYFSELILMPYSN